MKKKKVNNYKIAFIGWNPFQLLHVKTLILAIPNSVFIIEKRADNNIDFFSEDLFKGIEHQIVIVHQKEIKKLDEQYDVIITQTLFRDIHKIKKAKIVMLQYGYAKEPYNYGEWRALASLCLTYGAYATEKIAPLCPSVATGNPRYDMWKELSFHQNSINKYQRYIDSTKKTILYIPTWGELSSFNLYIESIGQLNSKYNVLVKLHHNTDYLELGRVENIKKKGITYFGANDDILELLSVSDMVISDYSGAIFDAIYCHRPVILLDLPDKKILKCKKIDTNSLEFNQRDMLGSRVTSPIKLKEMVDIVIENSQLKTAEFNELRTNLFIKTDNARDNIYTTILNLMNGKYKKTQNQQDIHKKVVESYTKPSLWKIIRKYLIETYLYLLSFRRKNAQ